MATKTDILKTHLDEWMKCPKDRKKRAEITKHVVFVTGMHPKSVPRAFRREQMRSHGKTEGRDRPQAKIKGFGQRGAMYLLAHRVRTLDLKKATDELRQEIGEVSTNRYRKLVEAVLLDTAASKDKVNVLAYLH